MAYRCAADLLRRARRRHGRRVRLLRNNARVGLRRHRRAAVEADAVDRQILYHALDLVSRFGKRNALDPVDRVDLGIARIAIRLDPVPHPAPAGIVTGKGHDVIAFVFR